jgi:hypothetical protein
MKRNRTLVIAGLLAGLGPLVGNGLYAGPGSSGETIAEAREGLPSIAYLPTPWSCSASPHSLCSSPGWWCSRSSVRRWPR